MQMKRPSSIKGLILSTIALSFLFLSGNAAHAAMVNYSFTGSVSDVSGALKSTLPLTSSMHGTFEYASDTMPSGTGRYMGAVRSLSLTIGTRSFMLEDMGDTNVIRITDSSSGDLWRLRTSVAGDPIGAFTPVDFRLNLADEDGLAITGTTLSNPPSLGDLTSTHWRLVFENMDGSKTVRIQGALNSLTAVPLPAAVILFGAGLISLVGLGAGGLRNLRRHHQA